MKIGMEAFLDDTSVAKSWGNCGLVCNQSSVIKDYQPSWSVLNSILGNRLKCFFGPQHGFVSTQHYNMIETPHSIHIPTGKKVYSLYSKVREPSEQMLKEIDTILFDLPITGTRIYTYKYTLAACMRAAKKFNKKVVVMDRPNPLGGEIVEGRVIEPDCFSFVGEFPIPVRHGLTMGELAKFFNKSIGCELDIISMKGWARDQSWSDLDREWVLSSPYMPNMQSLLAFPGMVLLEGTNLSEGRGTCLPFSLIGAPYIKSADDFVEEIYSLLSPESKKYIFLRPTQFEPVDNKWSGKTCVGLQIHFLNPKKASSYELALALIHTAIQQSGGEFEWEKPGYEYNYDDLPICLIVGHKDTARQFEAKSIDVKDEFWHQGKAGFIDQINNDNVLIYPGKYGASL